MAALTREILADPTALTRVLVDIPSVSGTEDVIADTVAAALATAEHLTVHRSGNTVVAMTSLGRDRRVVLAGHLDTVPIAGNLPSRVEDGRIYGCGSCDMKSGTALGLHLAMTEPAPRYDVTYIFYDCEEVEAARNGLNRVAAEHPEWLAADFAVLLEPSSGRVEAGCQGTMRGLISTSGHRVHSARSWLGVNAIHGAAEVLGRLAAYEPRQVTIDGCTYREGLNAVGIRGGVAGNVVPDRCEIDVNYRFAPDRSEAEAADHLHAVFAGFDLVVTDSAPGALPGLEAEPAREFIAATGMGPVAKYGWTDVSRFAGLGIAAVNFGPGDPNLAHTRDEYVEIDKIVSGAELLRGWLRPATGG